MSRNGHGHVQAAGGIVRRSGRAGQLEVAVVHRPKRADWSLPKGKAEQGERAEETALREVQEEIGLRCRLEQELGSVRYRDRRGRPKVVRYWAMTPLSGEFAVNEEVDELRWLTVADAVALLTHKRDRRLVRRAARAGDRKAWTGGRLRSRLGDVLHRSRGGIRRRRRVMRRGRRIMRRARRVMGRGLRALSAQR